MPPRRNGGAVGRLPVSCVGGAERVDGPVAAMEGQSEDCPFLRLPLLARRAGLGRNGGAVGRLPVSRGG